VALLIVCVQRSQALVYCVTNVVDYHRNAPTGELAHSGWQETALIGDFLGTVIQSNALLTAKHLAYTNAFSFSHEGQSRTVTSYANDAESDFSVLFFTPAVTNIARINIETNDIVASVVLQGRGRERGDAVVTGGLTNGWKWGRWRGVRRWGVNRYFAADPGDDTYAIAAFDNTGDPDECMLSPGDSGGPGFIRTASGWKLATVNYSVDPATFTVSTNPVASFEASLYDCARLFHTNGVPPWQYVPPEASPSPCLLINTRTAKRISWITNTVAGITFPADVGIGWRCETNAPSAGQAARGLWFEVVATNAGPYAARDLAIDIEWPSGLRVRGGAATHGSFTSNRWSLPSIEDGGVATLRVDTVVWRAACGWGTNRASVAASDKPDAVASNNTAACVSFLPETATRVWVE
jgi:hypothetical protein